MRLRTARRSDGKPVRAGHPKTRAARHIAAEESGDVERLTAWLVRQTGVRLDTLKQHYARWWPRDPAAIRATYALLDPAVAGQIVTRGGDKSQTP